MPINSRWNANSRSTNSSNRKQRRRPPSRSLPPLASSTFGGGRGDRGVTTLRRAVLIALVIVPQLHRNTVVVVVDAQLAICPSGFTFGGLCGISGGALLNGACPLSLPPFHCIRGSCCRDIRPLFQRLLPTFYPPGFGLNTIYGGFCFDRALNCFLYTTYCFVPIYTLCMATHCGRTCGSCLGGAGIGAALGPFGALGPFRRLGFGLGLPGLGFGGLGLGLPGLGLGLPGLGLGFPGLLGR